MPNNLIAPCWTYLTADASSHIYFDSGGYAPYRYAVVQWRQVHDGYSTNTFTFQVLLWENGDIQAQYQTMDYGAGSYYCASTGIEDSAGQDGLLYQSCNQPGNDTAVRFIRPAPAARVQVRPLYQGQFASVGSLVDFRQRIRNTGELGADVYDLTTSTTWPLQLYAADGTTLLTDTDGDGVVDTGPVAQASTVEIVVRVEVPSGAASGDHNTALVTATSSLDVARAKKATLQAAVPAPFAQVYYDGADYAMSLYLVQPAGQAVREATGNYYYGYQPAVVETAGGNLLYAWRRYGSVGSVYGYEIEYALFDAHGERLRGPVRLTSLSGAVFQTYDLSPAVAATPDGHIGVLWYRYLYNPEGSRYLYNVYFAILDAAGQVVLPPTNLTNNTEWFQYNPPTYNAPRFYTPHLAATGDNRFVLTWIRNHMEEAGYVDDIYYAIRDSLGNEAFPITRFTYDTPGYDEAYSGPNVACLPNNRVLLTYTRQSDGDIYYAVLDSSGGVVHPAMNLVGDGTVSYDQLPDAVALSTGQSIVAWVGGAYPDYDIRFAVLDAAYNRTVGPVALVNPAAPSGEIYVSLAADAAGRAIFTWMDYGNAYLYYALVDGTGAMVTPPMIFRAAVSPYIITSYIGYGNTSYSWVPAAGVDGLAAFSVSLVGAAPGGGAGLPLHYGNFGATTAASVVLTATLGSGLSYQDDTSGYLPIVSGNQVVWNLPDLKFLERGDFVLRVAVAPTATVGARLPVTLKLASAGPEENPDDNHSSAEVMVAVQCYLPLAFRSR